MSTYQGTRAAAAILLAALNIFSGSFCNGGGCPLPNPFAPRPSTSPCTPMDKSGAVQISISPKGAVPAKNALPPQPEQMAPASAWLTQLNSSFSSIEKIGEGLPASEAAYFRTCADDLKSIAPTMASVITFDYQVNDMSANKLRLFLETPKTAADIDARIKTYQTWAASYKELSAAAKTFVPKYAQPAAKVEFKVQRAVRLRVLSMFQELATSEKYVASTEQLAVRCLNLLKKNQGHWKFDAKTKEVTISGGFSAGDANDFYRSWKHLKFLETQYEKEAKKLKAKTIDASWA